MDDQRQADLAEAVCEAFRRMCESTEMPGLPPSATAERLADPWWCLGALSQWARVGWERTYRQWEAPK